MTITNGLTIDLEDYYHANKFAGTLAPREKWPIFPPRVRQNTELLLSIFRECKVKATFFVLGWVAERNKNLILEIASEGHEIASHGYWHKKITECSPREFQEDARRSKNLLENIIQKPVFGYRAANFSLKRETFWALEILAQENFLYDSSVYPMHPFSKNTLPIKEHQKIETTKGSIYEFPIATLPLGKWNIPVGGGGYFRLLPYALTNSVFSFLNRRCKRLTFYIHPWDLDWQQPRFLVSPLAHFRHYVNLRSACDKLHRLVANFTFAPLLDILKEESLVNV